MSYDQWKTGMLVTGAVSALFGGLIWIFWGSGIEFPASVILMLLLCALVILSFQKPERVWAVATIGIAKGGSGEIPKSYGPFHSKDAAVNFRNGWDKTYKGFSVVECRNQEK